MLLLKFIRKMGKVLRGGVADRVIMLGGLLGLAIGMVPGFNMTLVLLVLALLLLNAHFHIALLGFAVGKILCLALAPLTFRIGYFIIHGIGLEGFFRFASDAPVLALMDLHVYSLVGGLPLGLVLGLVFGWLMVRAVHGLRVGLVEATERSQKMRRLAANPVVRVFLRLVFGPKKAELGELLKEHPPVLRKSGFIVVGVAVALLLVGQYFFLDRGVKAGIERGVGMAHGAQVDVERARLSLTGGLLDLAGLQATDREDPARNAFEAGRLAASINVPDLLRKRYVINEVAVSNVLFGTERAAPGEVFKLPPPDEPEPEPSPLDYLEQARELRDRLLKLKEYLEMVEARREKQREKQREKLQRHGENIGYLTLSAQDILAERPTWVIRNVVIEGLRLPIAPEPQKLQATELTSHPELTGRPMVLTMTPEGADPTAHIELNFDRPDAVHTAAFRLRNVSLGDVLRLSGEAPVDVEGGRADIVIAGTFSATSLDFPFELDLTDLQAAVRPGQSFLGLDPDAAARMLDAVGELRITGSLTGSPGAPRVEINAGEVLASMRESLVAAGRAELANLVDEQAERLGKEIRARLDDEIRDRLPGLEGVFPRRQEPPAEEDDEDEPEPQRRPEDRLRDMFR